MANEPVPACTGPDLTHPDFATRLLREPDTAHRHALLSQALLRFLVRSGSLDDRADVETPAVLESLIAVELNVVLDARLGVETDLSTLRHPVCASDLAANVLDLMDGTAPPPASQVLAHDADGRFEPFALTDLQQAYLLGRGEFFALGSVPAAFYAEIDAESVDVERLEAAWNAVVARHDMLRAVFTEDGRQQVTAETPAYRFARNDLRGAEPADRDDRLASIREEIAGKVRAPEQWPLFEIGTTRLDDRHTRIHIAVDLMIADAPSIRQLLGEWLAVDAENDPGPLPEVTFRDYVLGLEAVGDSAGFRAARDYWLERIAELPPAPELPLRTPMESVAAAQFSSRSFELSGERWARLRQRALASGLTPSMVLCWAYAATLRTWSASDDFTLNVTVNDRLPVHPDIDRVIGEYTSQVLVAVDVDATTPVHTQIGTLQDRFWQDFEHRGFSGVQVLRELARSDGGSRTTMPYVFDAVLGQDLATADLPEWFRGIPYVAATAPQVALECQVFELGGVLRVNWAVVDELFPPGMIDAAFAAFGGLLERLADDEGLWEQRELDLVGSPELAARDAANATQGALPRGLLHELGGPLRARGSAPAVIAPDRSLTYDELDRRAARIARKLREVGAEPNTLVAVVMEKGWEQPVAALGVLQAGAAYLPIDATWPGDRIRHVLERGRCQIVLTQSQVSHAWPSGSTVLAVDDEAVWEGLDDSPVDCPAGPEDLAYVIFTSGSTGEPKGVVIDHRGAANTVADINKRYSMTAADRVLGLSSLSFDLSVWDIFGMLAAGGALVLPPSSAGRDPESWQQLMRQYRVSVWNTVPALMEMLVEHTTAARLETIDKLRLVLMSGDWIPLSLPERIRACAPGAEIISLGGATEASIWSIHHPINQLDPTWPSIPYGQPLTNQTFHILSSHTLEPVPTWVPGELFIAGTGLAHGYWDDPHKTADRFLTHPTTHQPLYRTGDLGRYHPDGTIEFLGRNDHQVKINGYRIELGEIETQLTTHPTIKDALVTATNNHLTAYLIPADPGYASDPDTLIAGVRESLAAALPDYMVPRSHVVLDAMPLSANGKVDRAALPAPVPKSATHDSVAVDEDGSEPRNDIERRLRVIWLDVLNIGSVGIHDEFGELGGDSLLALRVIGKAADAGLSLSPRQFFEHPTIAGLAGAATLVAPRTGSEPEAAVVGDVPLLPAQAMLLAGLDGRVARRHNYALLLELDDAMDKVALRVAVRTLVTRHDAFRTGFVHGPDGWVQRVEPADAVRSVPLEWIDIAELSNDEQDVSVEELSEAAQRSFDLAEPPLLRVLYFERGRGRRPVLLLVAHWLAVDNFSLRLVLEELLTAHGQIAEEGQARLPAPTVSAARWAMELERHAERLGAVRPEHHPQVAAEDAAAVARDAVTLIDVLDARAVAALREQAGAAATLGDVLLAALARSARAAGLGDAIRVDVDGHGRAAALPSDSEEAPAADLSRTVGRVSVRYELRVPAVSDTEDGVRVVVAERSGHLNGGLDSAVARYGSRAHSGQAAVPAADFAFNYLGTVDELYAIPGLQPSTLRPGRLVHPDTPLRHRFELLCGTVDGELLIGVTTPGDGRAAGEHLLKCLIADLGGSQAEEETAHGERVQGPHGGRGSGLAELFRRWLSPGTTE